MLLNPSHHDRPYPDEASRDIMRKTIAFFEDKGLRRLKDDDHAAVWYDDFLDFQKKEGIFATLLTPAGYGDSPDARWDTYRICEFAEILGFYGLAYWYTWQVSVLGLGPIWMSDNETLKQRAAECLRDGEIFAFALSERTHGADVYSTDMIVTRQDDGTYRASGPKYYIGNANKAAMVSVFGKMADTDEYVFFVADSRHPNYKLRRNVVNSQSYVAQFELDDYPLTDDDFLHRGEAAFHAALNTVNIGKYNLGWASIGIATHAFHEAIDHAANRHLYGMTVTDFPHVKQLFTDAFCRLTAMKLVALRAADYLRTASADDRRYLLYNPVVKMKVTTQGEDVIDHLWDVIAAKGFEKDMYFEMAARDIRALPKLEGTVHVNIALIAKFMPNFFFDPIERPVVGTVDDPVNDDFLFAQGPTRGLGKTRFHDYQPAFDAFDLPNVNLFEEQVATFKDLLASASPTDEQTKDIEFLLAMGEIFTLVVYAQLLLENAQIHDLDADVVDQIFDVFVRDTSHFALRLHDIPSSTPEQMQRCLQMIRKPVVDSERYARVWKDHVLALEGTYTMHE
jgi:acyl-CoA dehydrogenase